MALLLLVGIGLAVVALVWWHLRSLTQNVKELTRRQYEGQNDLREASRQQAEALTILRLHVALLASGRAVDGTLVQTGSLYHQANAEETQRLVESQASGTGSDLIVVDVRSQKEFLESHVPGAQHIPFEHLETRFQDEVPKETKKILVYCSQGERSRLACDFLSREGYTTLVNMRDGFQKWTGPVAGTGSATLVQIESRPPHHDVISARES